MKQSEVLTLSDAELREEIDKQTVEYADLKMAHAVSPLENPSQLKAVRKSVARLKTELSKRQDKQ